MNPAQWQQGVVLLCFCVFPKYIEITIYLREIQCLAELNSASVFYCSYICSSLLLRFLIFS